MKIFKQILYFIFKIYVILLFAFTAILFFPILTFATSNKRFHKLAFNGFTCWSIILRIFAFWPFRVKKNQKPSEKPYIIIANHSSYADIFFTPSLFRKHPHVFLGKSEILSYPIIKYYFMNYNIPVYRGNRDETEKTLNLAKEKIKDGWSIIIFPEGGIPDNVRPNMIPFKDGAFRLAKETNTPILPVTFVNNYRLFTDPTDIWGTCHPGCVNIVIHPEISIENINNLSIEKLKEMAFNTIQSALK